MKKSIGEAEINAAYDLASKVFHGDLPEKAAVDELVEINSMNRASASDYVRNFAQMLNGKSYHRTLSQLGTDIYFQRILNDYGKFYLDNAISATRAHLAYYEMLPKGGRLPGILKICEQFQNEQSSNSFASDIITEFEHAVGKALLSSDKELDARLATAPKLPQKRYCQHVMVIRNPDVVAKILRRAKGICEACASKAPFAKRTNGTPYLEVHHLIPLAEGGEDTVENAKALCPNCHRESHFGIEWEKFRP